MPLEFLGNVDILGRHFITQSNVNFYTNFAVATRLQFHPSEQNKGVSSLYSWTSLQEWLQLLSGPLHHLINLHTSLNVVIGDRFTGAPKYLRLGSIDLSKCVRVAPIKTIPEVAQVLEYEHNLAFDLSDHTVPLWRITIAPIADEPSSFYFIFIMQHSVFDGRSGMMLNEQIIERLNLQAKEADTITIVNSGKATVVPITSTKPVPPSYNQLVKCKAPLGLMASMIAENVLLPTFIKRAFEKKYWAGEVDASEEIPREIELILTQFSREETSKLIQATKRHSTTIQSILYTASMFAMRSVFLSDNNSDGFVFMTPVSARPYLPASVGDTELGNYALRVMHYNIRVEDLSEFWDMTHKYRKQIIHGTSESGRQEYNDIFGMLEYLPKNDGGYEKMLRGELQKFQHGREATLNISNIGRGWSQFKDTPVSGTVTEHDEFLVKEGVFSTGIVLTGTPIEMTVTTASGVMTIVTSWSRGALKGRARGELYVNEFKRILFEATEHDRETYLFKDAKKAYTV
ncbi:hypothetical protein BGZ49_007101 [Haplosporangium sp. Z 27]|nr:hypothetical protein BGZ49_007101 [Haplosporangium sp. Z 27]